MKIGINESSCVKCGSCSGVCPTMVITQPEKTVFPVADNLDRCIVCGHCAGICPTSSVQHSEFTPDIVLKIDKDKIPTIESTMELLLSRRSVREFKDKPVEKSDLETIVEAGLAAPSAHNSRSTEYIVITDPKLITDVKNATLGYWKNLVGSLKNPIARTIMRMVVGKKIEVAIKMLPMMEGLVKMVESGKDLILNDAKAVIVFHSDKNAELPDINGNLAYQNSSLAAEALGLGAYYCGFVLSACTNERDGNLKQVIGVPENHTVNAVMALGHPQYKYQNLIRRKSEKVTWR